MPQISASVKENTIKVIQEMADEDKRSFSNKVDEILGKAAASWIMSKSKSKKQSKTK